MFPKSCLFMKHDSGTRVVIFFFGTRIIISNPYRYYKNRNKNRNIIYIPILFGTIYYFPTKYELTWMQQCNSLVPVVFRSKINNGGYILGIRQKEAFMILFFQEKLKTKSQLLPTLSYPILTDSIRYDVCGAKRIIHLCLSACGALHLTTAPDPVRSPKLSSRVWSRYLTIPPSISVYFL